MRKSKYGYILLALLVTTGLAGTITSTSISNKERKFAANLMKDTKADLLNAVNEISATGRNLEAVRTRSSLKRCVFQVVLAEEHFFDLVKASMSQPANPEKRAEIKLTDDELMTLMPECCAEVEKKQGSWKTVDEALDHFKELRTEHIKYIKNTTEDLRNHVVRTSLGSVDCYQLCLIAALHTSRHLQQINEIKKRNGFPKGK